MGLKRNRGLTYGLLLSIHFIVALLAFPEVLLHPAETALCNWGDGLKNYFTLQAYVNEPLGADGLLKFNSFNYPYGDYVYYTDNTPLFSVPFRWFCLHVWDVSAYAIPVFNWWIIAQILVSGCLVYYLIHKYTNNRLLTWLCAIVLPWTNVQIPRIWAGHFNLSVGVFVLMAICLYQKWHERNQAGKSSWVTAAGMWVLCLMAFMAHGYYMAIITMFLCFALFFSGWCERKSTAGKRSMMLSMLLPAMVLGTVGLLLWSTDAYLLLRQDRPMGYDWGEQKTNFTLLFSHYDFHTMAFPVASTRNMGTETMVYLGNTGLFALGLLAVGCFYSSTFRRRFRDVQRSFFSNPMFKGLFLGSLVLLSVSMGEYYTTNRAALTLYMPGFLSGNGMAVLLAAGTLSAILFIALKKRNPANRFTAHALLIMLKRKWKVLIATTIIIYLLVGQYTATLPNITNPFFYLHFLTRRVEQFRSLARFMWPFYWVFNFWVIWTVAALYKRVDTRKTLWAMAIGIIAVAGLSELKDFVVKLRSDANETNYFSWRMLQAIKPDLPAGTFQSIIPIPFFMAGSEDFEYTLDDHDTWSRYCMQLSLACGKPLVASKMSRTPPEFGRAIIKWLAGDQIAPSLYQRLGQSPMLVVQDKTLAKDEGQIPANNDVAKQFYKDILRLPERNHLLTSDTSGSACFYLYTLKRF